MPHRKDHTTVTLPAESDRASTLKLLREGIVFFVAVLPQFIYPHADGGVMTIGLGGVLAATDNTW